MSTLTQWKKIRTRWWFRWPVDLSLMLAIFWLVSAWQTRDPLPITGQILAPDFELPALDGQIYNLPTLRTKTTILYFFAPWCTVCKLIIGNLRTLRQSVDAEELSIVIIALGEKRIDTDYNKIDDQFYEPKSPMNPNELEKDWKLINVGEIDNLDPTKKVFIGFRDMDKDGYVSRGDIAVFRDVFGSINQGELGTDELTMGPSGTGSGIMTSGLLERKLNEDSRFKQVTLDSGEIIHVPVEVVTNEQANKGWIRLHGYNGNDVDFRLTATIKWLDDHLEQALVVETPMTVKGDLTVCSIDDMLTNGLDEKQLEQLRLNGYTVKIDDEGKATIILSNCPEILEGIKVFRLIKSNTNNIYNIDKLTSLPNLEKVNLGFNKLDNITIPSCMSSLKWLNLSGNNLTDITIPMGMSNLEILYVFGNKLTSVTFLSDMSRLRHLDLSENQLDNITLPPDMSSLTQLDLSVNQLKNITLPPGMSSLKWLNLSDNPAGLIVNGKLAEPKIYQGTELDILLGRLSAEDISKYEEEQRQSHNQCVLDALEKYGKSLDDDEGKPVCN